MRMRTMGFLRPPPPADGSESHPYRGSAADAAARVLPRGRDGCTQPSAGGGGGTNSQVADNNPITDGSESHPYRAMRMRP